MPLKNNQVSVTLGRLYEVTLLGGASGIANALNASIWANNTISIYGSESATEPAALADMTLQEENTDVSGTLVLSSAVSALPRYIAITGAASEVVATGLVLDDKGAIS